MNAIAYVLLIRPLNVLTVRAEIVEGQPAIRQGERILKLHEAGSICNDPLGCAIEPTPAYIAIKVKALAVEVDVNLPGFSKRSDADIARSVENVLQWVAFLPQEAIKVMVEDSWITLTGNVTWEYQRKGAIAAIRNLMGVRGVSDNITLKAEVSNVD